MPPARCLRSAVVSTLVLFGIVGNASGTPPATGTITGKILMQGGTPAKSVSVKVIDPTLASTTPSDEKGDGKDVIAKTTTDDAGQYTCKNLPPGAYRVLAGSLATGMAVSPAKLAAGATLTVDLTIKPPHRPG